MRGRHRFALALGPARAPEDLPATWERLTFPAPAAEAPGGGHLPPVGSLLEVEGAEVSSVRRTPDGIEARVWNPSSSPRRARVAGRSLDLGPSRIETVRLPAP